MRLLDIPPELRHQIFEDVLQIRSTTTELFYATKVGEQSECRLDLALLRVCRQIYKETTSLLYNEKRLIRIRMDPAVTLAYRRRDLQILINLIDFNGTLPVVYLDQSANQSLESRVTLDIALSRSVDTTLNAASQGSPRRQSRQNGPSEETAIFFLADLHDFVCHFIPCCDIGQLGIETQIRRNDDSRLRGALKHNLHDVRGFADASIVNRHGDNIEQELCQDLTRKITDREGNLEELRRYENRALESFEEMHFDIALRHYRDAQRYLYFIFSQDERIPSSSLEQRRRLSDVEIDMKLQSVTCFLYLLPHRLTSWVEEGLFRIFNKSSGHPEEQAMLERHRAHAYLVYGLIALEREKSNPNVALHSFFRALCERPGYDAAKKEVERLENTYTSHRWHLLHTNIARMKEVRHRQNGQRQVDIERVRGIEKGWIGPDRILVYHDGIDQEKVCLSIGTQIKKIMLT